MSPNEEEETPILVDYLRTKAVQDRFTDMTEVRAQENRARSVLLLDGIVTSNTASREKGVSARVRRAGSYGFAADSDYSPASILSVIDAATKNASFLDGRLKKGKPALKVSPAIENFDGLQGDDDGTAKRFIEYLQALDAYIVKAYPDLLNRRLRLNTLVMEKMLLTSEGVFSHTVTPRTLLLLLMTKQDKEGNAVEIYDPIGGYGYFGNHFNDPKAIFESIDRLYEKLSAKAEGVYAKSGRQTVVLDADLAGILAHEAIGHTVEADLVAGGSVAGPNFGKKVASEKVTLIDYAHTAFGERCPVPITVDDEGTKAEDAVLIKDGILTSFMHNRESAEDFGHRAQGNARAYAYDDEPLIRMRNTCIVPGKDKFEDMIASVNDGYYFVRCGNGQADTTSEFMFAVTEGYEIKGGKIGKAIKETTISGVAFDVLQTVDMIADNLSWSCAGMCGKKQMIPVGMGGPAIKCQVNVGGRI